MIKKLFFAVFLLINTNLLAQTPVLKNFEIRDSSPNKVYFTAEGDISNLTKQGFIISGKTISSINISEKSFTVSTPFTFWDNNTIRLENGDGTVHDFTLEYISNNIDEPEATANTYYVATDGSDSNDGTSINTPFVTFQKALDVATAGSTIYVKAGTYITTDHTYLENSGTSTAPIKVIGYKADPVILDSSTSDITSMYYSFTAGSEAPDLEPSEMPLIDGNNLAKYALHADGDDYYIFKNIQIQRFTVGFSSWDSEGIIIENCITKDMYGDGAKEGSGINLVEKNNDGHDFNPTYFRVKNTIAINGGMSNIFLGGSHNLVENCKTYCDKSGGSGLYGSDYFIAIMGDRNIVRNSSAEAKDGSVNNSSHGVGARGPSKIWTGSGYLTEGAWGSYTSYNLFQNLFIKSNSNQAIQSRNPRSDNNVWKDIVIDGFGTGSGIVSQTGAKNNIYERIIVNNVANAFHLSSGTEGSRDPALLHTSGNIARNIVVKNVTRVLITTNAYTDVIATYDNNKFY